MLDTVSEPKVENPVDYSPSDSEGKKSSTSSTSSNSKDPCRGIDDDPICNFEDAAVKQGIDNECKDAKGDKLKECCNVVRTRLNNFLKECKDNPKKNPTECEEAKQHRDTYNKNIKNHPSC